MDFNNTCRLCLTENLQFFSVFDECEEINQKLSDVIKTIAGVEYRIDEFDLLSKNICNTCKNLCRDFYRFRESIILNGDYQLKSVKQITIKNESQHEEIIINEQRFEDENNCTPFTELNPNEDNDEFLLDELNVSNHEYMEATSSEEDEDDDGDSLPCSKCSTSRQKNGKMRMNHCKKCRRKITNQITRIKHENSFGYKKAFGETEEEDEDEVVDLKSLNRRLKRLEETTNLINHNAYNYMLLLREEIVKCQVKTVDDSNFNNLLPITNLQELKSFSSNALNNDELRKSLQAYVCNGYKQYVSKQRKTSAADAPSVTHQMTVRFIINTLVARELVIKMNVSGRKTEHDAKPFPSKAFELVKFLLSSLRKDEDIDIKVIKEVISRLHYDYNRCNKQQSTNSKSAQNKQQSEKQPKIQQNMQKAENETIEMPIKKETNPKPVIRTPVPTKKKIYNRFKTPAENNKFVTNSNEIEDPPIKKLKLLKDVRTDLNIQS